MKSCESCIKKVEFANSRSYGARELNPVPTAKSGKNSAKIFWPLRFALCASGSLFVSQDMVPQGLENRLELALAYIKKAQTFNFFSNPDHLHVLSLAEIGSAWLRLDRNEGYRYIKLAVQIAKSIGLNTEAGVASFTCFDYEQENIRRIWWFMYTIYSTMTKWFGVELFADNDGDLFLPAEKYFKPESELEIYGKEIMRNPEWFTPSIKSQSVMGYRILLHRIELRIQKYILLELSDKPINTGYIFGSLCGSLREWFETVRKEMCVHYNSILDKTSQNLPLSWLALFTILIYNNNVLELIFPKFMKNILLGKKVQNSPYFNQATEAALFNSSILNAIKLYNPKMEHLNPQLFKFTFKSGFFLQCTLKIHGIASPQLETAYALHVESLLDQGVVFQRTNNFYNILLHLKDMDLYNSILTFGEFSARKFDIAFEKPQVALADQFQNVKIN
ncbi:hypothetical protein HK103_002466 [Boothiomyces macroporosus]|uniref:Xylanolytic transcriptional activator regulatory domain-containing protein n=1 Tax=Boothiomyces macroporosus TaxID=261099 RepID=A0AAD5UD69_9FUNG|nr:hypothetical protein HK103_002466 [Boothiomyces macroporosus]